MGASTHVRLKSALDAQGIGKKIGFKRCRVVRAG